MDSNIHDKHESQPDARVDSRLPADLISSAPSCATGGHLGTLISRDRCTSPQSPTSTHTPCSESGTALDVTSVDGSKQCLTDAISPTHGAVPLQPRRVVGSPTGPPASPPFYAPTHRAGNLPLRPVQRTFQPYVGELGRDELRVLAAMPSLWTPLRRRIYFHSRPGTPLDPGPQRTVISPATASIGPAILLPQQVASAPAAPALPAAGAAPAATGGAGWRLHTAQPLRSMARAVLWAMAAPWLAAALPPYIALRVTASTARRVAAAMSTPSSPSANSTLSPLPQRSPEVATTQRAARPAPAAAVRSYVLCRRRPPRTVVAAVSHACVRALQSGGSAVCTCVGLALWVALFTASLLVRAPTAVAATASSALAAAHAWVFRPRTRGPAPG